MAGLSVLLEQRAFPKYTRIVSKTSVLKNSSPFSAAPTSSSTQGSTFLEYCYLCRRKLQEGQDIYMYRDRAFCSEECRCRQIFMDEESGKRDHCSLAAAAAADGKYRAGRRRPRAAAGERALAGGFAY